MFKHILISAVLLFSLATIGVAQERIALVIGNGNYEYVGPLDNPVRDADLMAEALTLVGFRVIKITDSDQNTMKRGIAEFGRELRQAGTDATALFYYAGHAVQSFGNNYLLPVDSNIQHQADLDLYGVEADGILRQLFAARAKTSIVILDACRNNPFERLNGFGDKGLAEMDAPTGSFIAYATSPGKVATDGSGQNSPYTAALADAILDAPQPIEQLFKAVRVEVLNKTDGAQTPWDSSSLTSDFYFREPAANDGATEAERNFWNSVQNTNEIGQLELFLKLYPRSVFRDEATERLALLRGQQTDDGTGSPSAGSGADAAVITFTSPLTEGAPHIVGRSIKEIFTTGSPMFPPFEGIPDELWKGQKCSNCHQWTQELLCEQGQFYLSTEATRSLEKKHPLGGTFKMNLGKWAETGCR